MGALVLIFQSNMLITTLCHRNPDFKKWKIAALLDPPIMKLLIVCCPNVNHKGKVQDRASLNGVFVSLH